MADIIKAGGVTLPAPSEITADEEIIWSSNTGRTSNGTMTGDVIAEKKNIKITWNFVTHEEYKRIKTAIKPGFFSLTINFGESYTATYYRGSLSNVSLGKLSDGKSYYQEVSASIIQQ